MRAACIVVLVLMAQSRQRERADLSDYLPPGEARDLFVRQCSACHDLQGVIRLRKPRPAWDAIVADMVARGAPLMIEEVDPIVGYLAAAFGPQAPPLLDVNTAEKEELMKLPGVTPEMADRFIERRTSSGPLASREEFRTVLGLDEQGFEKIKWYVRVGKAGG